MAVKITRGNFQGNQIGIEVIGDQDLEIIDTDLVNNGVGFLQRDAGPFLHLPREEALRILREYQAANPTTEAAAEEVLSKAGAGRWMAAGRTLASAAKYLFEHSGDVFEIIRELESLAP